MRPTEKTLKFNWDADTQARFEGLMAGFEKKHGRKPSFADVRPPGSEYHLNVMCAVVTHLLGKPVDALEIGSYFGESSRIFAGHFSDLICVDAYGKTNEICDIDDTKETVSHKWDTADEIVKYADENELIHFIFSHNVVDLHDNISHFHMTSDDYFVGHCLLDFDFIYVDGDHRYSQQMRDYTHAQNFIRENGIIGGHDFSWESTQKVIRDMGWEYKPILHFLDDSFIVVPEELI